MPARPLIIFASPATEAVLRQQGLGSLDQIFRKQAEAHVRHNGRAVWKTELRGADGSDFYRVRQTELGTPPLVAQTFGHPRRTSPQEPGSSGMGRVSRS